MASNEHPCIGCELATKYSCIICAASICNRSDCSVAEENDEIDGWIANKRVSYCKDCYFRPGERETATPKAVDDELSEAEGDEELDLVKEGPKGEKKNPGRRCLWMSEHVDDMVDIITNSEGFKRKLIFTNNKRATNTEVYKRVLEQIKERHPNFPFTVHQMRNKFKWCVSTCRKVALTVQTASGIKRFVEDRGFGKWFNALFPLIQSRDSCQPEQAIEPSSSATPSSSARSTPVAESLEREDDSSNKSERGARDMFVPIGRKKRKDKESEPAAKILKILEHMVENDPTQDLLQFLKEDAEKSRQNELELLKLLAGQSQVQGTWQQNHMHSQNSYFQVPIPQTPPQVPYSNSCVPTDSPTLHQPANTYTTL